MPKPVKSLYSCITTSAPRYLLRTNILKGLFQEFLQGNRCSFLEIGPGLGDISEYFISHEAIQSGTVIDQSAKSVDLLKARLATQKALDIRCADILEIDAGEFDYILSFEVLEHIQDDVSFINHVSAKLARRGLWFISVPAYMRKWQSQDEFSGHIRRYEKKELIDKLEAAGLKVHVCKDYGFPLTSLMRPLREWKYSSRKSGDELQKTLDSGTEHKMLTNRSPWPMIVLLSPFFILQKMFAFLGSGDGLIVVAEKASDKVANK